MVTVIGNPERTRARYNPAPMEKHPLNPDARALEEAFFAKENAKLLEKLRERAERDAQRRALLGCIPGADDALLDHLLDLGIGPETALAVMLVPLTSVAWADGSVDDKERAAIRKAAEERGLHPGTPAHAMLEAWLVEAPGRSMFETWKRYVRTVGEQLPVPERAELKSRILALSTGVAEAAGGILGLGSKVSAAERKVLDEIEAALR